MSLSRRLKRLAEQFVRSEAKASKRDLRISRRAAIEAFEPRKVMDADPIWVGGVYIEEDSGSDQHGDTFHITFKGGAAGTQLRRLVIDGDQGEAGFNRGDNFFDTVDGGLGADHSFPFKIEQLVTANSNATVRALVEDGSTKLILEFENFQAGDLLVFSIDVDEVEGFDPNETDLKVINSYFDPITSGVEFQTSKFQAEFIAPHYEDVAGQSFYVNMYDPVLAPTGLDLPADDKDGKRDRSAGAALQLQQIAKPIWLEGIVYEDFNQNLVKDANDTGIANVELELWRKEGNQYVNTGFTTRTDSQGSYRFGLDLKLKPGTYQVRESQPEGYFSVGATPGFVDGRSTGQIVVGNKDILTEITIPLGDTFATKLNFAEARYASISGHVCVTKPGKDCFSSTPGDLEPLANVKVDLLDETGTLIASTLTAADGSYRFENLKAGVYTVVEHTPENLLDGSSRAGVINGVAAGTVVDSNRISAIALLSGSIAEDFDFCEIPPAKLSGHVYEDVNDDGIRQSTERLLAGVTIELLDSQGNRVEQTTTDTNGFYQFTFLRPGSYRIRETQPAGFIDGKDQAGTINGQTVGQVNSQQDLISDILLPSGMEGINYDFGELRNGTISGRVFTDTNGNCILDASNEELLANVLVQLLDRNGTVVAETRTDAQGRYRFENLRPGTYAVRETQPEGFFQGGQKAGSAGGDVSIQDLISQIPLLSGGELIDYDFCEVPPASIAGIVHVDNNGDCIIQPTERRLAGVTIELLDAQGNALQTTTTDADGSYRFSQLRPGTYAIREIQPTGFFQGGQRAGSGGGNVSIEDIISAIAIPAGEDLVEYNFCEIEPATIAGIVHVDNNGDCIIQPNEQRLAGVTIELLDAQGNVLQTTTTAADGSYRFTQLRPGTYAVREIQPTGFFQGGQRVGSGGGDASIADVISAISIPAGEDLVEYNFCEVEPVALAGTVYVDNDGDCVQDDVDQPIAGVKIQLFDVAGNVIQTTFTDTSGNYRFDSLRPGNYTVRQTQPENFFQGGQTAPDIGADLSVADRISNIVLQGGQRVDDLDFCERPPAKISGYVFQDGGIILTTDGEVPDKLRPERDGQLTNDDKRIANVTLELRLVTGKPVSSDTAIPGTYTEEFIRVKTDANGYFEFDGLQAGTYHIYQVQPEGYVDGLDTAGSLGGESANSEDIEPGSPEQQFVLQLASNGYNPNSDAILLIELDYGQHAQFNNFSEVLVDKRPEDPQGPYTPGNPPGFSPQMTTGLYDSPFARVLPTAPPAAGPLPLLIGGAVEQPFTWHLSVINSGKPRGERLDKSINQDRIARSTVLLDVTHWTVVGMKQSKWSIISTATKLPRSVKDVFSVPGAKALSGDFNGDGVDELALYFEGEWLIDINGNGEWDPADLWARLGKKDDSPVVGDWDGDGKDDIGIFGPEWEKDSELIAREPGLPDPGNKRITRPKNLPPETEETPDRQRLMLHTARGQGRADVIDHVFQFGIQKDQAITGDFNGDGISTIGIYRDGKWSLDVDGDGMFTDRDLSHKFGKPGDIAVTGDFDGDGIDEIAIVRGNKVIVDSNKNGEEDATDRVFELESTDGQVIIGDFDGDGSDEPAILKSEQDVPLQARRAG